MQLDNLLEKPLLEDNEYPKISLITASYNQGQYIEETFKSVIAQNYPNLEYIVIDGQSQDNTLEVIHKYEKYLSYWLSEPDKGAADAIEKGRQMCQGELFNWLNSDDYLLPGTLLSLGCIAQKFPNFDIYAFISVGAGADGALKSYFSKWPNMNLYLTSCRSIFGQESTFVRSSFLHKNKISIHSEYSNVFDTILYEEMLAKGARVLFIDVFGGVMRHHPTSKTHFGVPEKDLQTAKQFLSEIFSRKQRVWRRITTTRFSYIFDTLCRFNLTRKLINFIIDQADRKFIACDFIGTFCNSLDSWELRFK